MKAIIIAAAVAESLRPGKGNRIAGTHNKKEWNGTQAGKEDYPLLGPEG